MLCGRKITTDHPVTTPVPKRDSMDKVINNLEKKKSCNVGELGLDIEPARLGSVQLELAH